MSAVYKRLCEELETKKLLNRAHLEYIEALSNLGIKDKKSPKKQEEFSKMKVPEKLPFVFYPEYDINSICEVRVLSNGKSAPLQLTICLKKETEKGKS